MKSFSLLTVILLITAVPRFSGAEARVDSNVVFGMYSGLALLMDVHYPEQPNGYGIIHISGSGWTKSLAYNATPLTQQRHVELEAQPLVEAGYTVFTVNHRATPRFQYPAPVEDVQRAVRFVRYHAADYGIDSERIGAMGGSSGGHLVSMLGVLDGHGDPSDPDPVNQVSARVQCVVGRAVPADLSTAQGIPSLVLLLGARNSDNPESEEARRYRAASPVNYVSADDSPFLFLHGDADDVVPFEQAELFAGLLAEVGVAAEIVRMPGGGHGPSFNGAQNPPDHKAAMISWFDQHLKK